MGPSNKIAKEKKEELIYWYRKFRKNNSHTSELFVKNGKNSKVCYFQIEILDRHQFYKFINILLTCKVNFFPSLKFKLKKVTGKKLQDQSLDFFFGFLGKLFFGFLSIHRMKCSIHQHFYKFVVRCSICT